MSTALITGITGQDGGYLAELLVSGGVQVHGTVRLGETAGPHLAALGDGVVLHELDLLDSDRLRQVVDEVGADEVYSLAGISSVAQSWAQPVLTSRVNAVAVAALLDAVQQQQERTGRAVRLLQASTAELFAGATSAPQDETTPLSPRSPYGASKAHAHALCQAYRHVGVHAATVILYNHESPRRPTTFVTRKITSAVAAIADGRADDLVLGSLSARRDWGWAPEYVQAMVLAARHAEPADFVLATGVGHTVEDFVATAFTHVGIEDWARYVRTDPAFSRPADAVALVGDPTRAATALGWRPRVGFAELVGRMVDSDRR